MFYRFFKIINNNKIKTIKIISNVLIAYYRKEITYKCAMFGNYSLMTKKKYNSK